MMRSTLKKSWSAVELVDAYVASRPPLQPGAAKQLRYSEKAFAAFLKCPARLEHFTDDTINQFVSWRLQTASLATAKRNRNHLVLLWKFAAYRRLVSICPANVKAVVVEKRKAESHDWTLSDLLKLLVAADRLRGRMPSVNDRPRYQRLNGVPCSQWWTSLILFLRDTGAKVSTALRVRPANIDLDRGEVVLRCGTSTPKVMPLSRPTIKAIC